MATSVDRFAQSNPAFVALTLRWTCEGYVSERTIGERVSQGLHPAIALISLALLSPDQVRDALPRTSNAKLPLLLLNHSEWRVGLTMAIRALIPAFWDGLRFGVATRTLSIVKSRVQAVGKTMAPSTPMSIDLKRRATALGKVLGKEDTDEAVFLAFSIGLSS
jgi:hypothetical protein